MAELPKYFYFRVTPVTNKGVLTQVMVEDASDADVVEVVRCKDCRFYTPYVKSDPVEGKCKGYKIVCSDDFCSDGERRSDNG